MHFFQNINRSFQRFRMQIAAVFLAGLTILSTPLAATASVPTSHQWISSLPPGTMLATLEGKAKANAKDFVGKLQEAAGDLTGSTKDQIVGKAKQSESTVDKVIEDVKDAVPGG